MVVVCGLVFVCGCEMKTTELTLDDIFSLNVLWDFVVIMVFRRN